ncbi:MAG: hypothetical protein AAF327_14625 [Cyanobacteria bacterium P01_A01_bin.37]
MNRQSNPQLDTDNGNSISRPKKKRLNLELSSDAYDLLQKLSDSSGKNMADVLRTGLALYGIAEQAKDEGRALGVVEGDKVVKEIVTT